MIQVTARAKINYCLHVLGKRSDGYHDLDSLVMFAEFGDAIAMANADALSVTFKGAFAQGLNPLKNSILDAVHWFENHAGIVVKQSISIEKNIPVMAGLGGGTADAAAVIEGLCAIYNLDRPDPSELAVLGADVPVSFYGQSARMRGIGEALEPWAHEGFEILLVNPRVAVETKAVFASPLLRFSHAIKSDHWDATHNDMEVAACDLCPQIRDIIAALKSYGANGVRMTGSGSTVFAIGENLAEVEVKMREQFPQFWTKRSVVKPSAQQPDHKAR